jgi:hypothetical protein
MKSSKSQISSPKSSQESVILSPGLKTEDQNSKTKDEIGNRKSKIFKLGTWDSKTIRNLIVFLHLVITLALAAKLNIWLDEAYTLHTTAQGVGRAFHQGLYFELQPPLYFVLMSLWRSVNGSIFFARLFSIICAALTVKLSYDLARHFFKNANPVLLTALVAFNPFIIWAAIEIRLYAFALLLSALLLLFFYDGYLAEKPSARAQAFYVVVAVCALYTQYYLGFLLVADFCALALFELKQKRWRLMIVYLGSMAVAAVCFAPMIFVTLKQVSAHTQTVIAPSLKKSIGDVSWRAQDYLLPTSGERMEFFRHWLWRFGLLGALALLFKRRLSWSKTNHLALIIITSIAALFFILVVHLTGEDLFEPKHSVALFLPLILCAWSIIAALGGRWAARAWLALALTFYATTLFAVYQPLAKKGDWQRVANYIEAHETANEPIFVFHAESQLPLSFYYTGRNPLFAVPHDLRFDRIDWRDFALTDEAQIQRAFARAGNAPEIWLVNDDFCSYLDVNFRCDLLEDYIAKNYNVESDKSFYQSRVRLLRAKRMNLFVR